MRALLILVMLLAVPASSQTPLIAAGLEQGARFGQSLAVSSCTGAQTRQVLVGSPHGTPDQPTDASGAVYLFRTESGLSDPVRVSSPTNVPGDLFGYSVSMARSFECDDQTYLVGAPGVRETYFYPTGLSPTSRRILLDGLSLGNDSEFGSSVTSSGSFGAVGAPGVSHGRGRVQAFILPLQLFPAVIDPFQTILPGSGGDRRFGHAVAFNSRDIPGSSPFLLAISAPGEGSVGGAVYVYRYGSLQNTGPQFFQETRFEGLPGFGESISFLGSDLAIGSRNENTVYVYRRTSTGTWSLLHTVDGSALPTGRFGAAALSLVPSPPPYVRVLASASGPDASATPEPPIALVSRFDGGTDQVPLPILTPTASGLYGAALATSVDPAFVYVIGDPGDSGTGSAFVVPGTSLPVDAEPSAATSALVSARLFPQPAARSVTLSLTAPSRVDVRVVDLLGREVIRTWSEGVGTRQQRLDTSGLAPGVYLVSVTDVRATATLRLLVAR